MFYKWDSRLLDLQCAAQVSREFSIGRDSAIVALNGRYIPGPLQYSVRQPELRYHHRKRTSPKHLYLRNVLEIPKSCNLAQYHPGRASFSPVISCKPQRMRYAIIRDLASFIAAGDDYDRVPSAS